MLLAPPLTGAPLVLPAGEEFGGPLARPVLARGGSPRAAVVLATLANRAASAGSLAAPAVLVGSRTLGSGVAVTRAHTPSGSTVGQQDPGGAWVEVAASEPRYDLPLRRLRVDGARTNSLPNPRGEGASGGTPPAGMTLSATRNLTHTFTRTTRGGVEGFLWQMSGTPNSTAGTFLSLEAGETSTAGRQCALGVFVELVAGSTSNFSALRLRQQNESAAGATDLSPTATMARVTNVTTAAGTSYRASINFAFANTVSPVAITLFLGWPTRNMDAAAVVQPILPPPGSPAASTRGIDVPIWTPAPMPARGAILLRGAADVIGAAVLGLLQLDNGTDTHRIVARIATSGQPECLVITSGVTVATLTPAGTIAAGAEWRGIVAWSPGAVRFGTTSGGVVSASVAAPPSLSRALAGHANAAGTLPLGGEITADLYSYWPSEAEALALLTT
jgi:hypothetical protein